MTLAQREAQLLHEIKVQKRLIAARKSRDSLGKFTTFTMPNPEDVDDVDLSLYQSAWHHEAIDEVLEKVERCGLMRVIITMPPRHGKSEKASRRFPAWFIGRDPYRQVIFATYGADFAEDFGRKVREIIVSPAYRQVFPGVKLKEKSRAADRMETEAGGMAVFIGVGGPATGRGADLLLIDDPFKNREEAESLTNRNKVWDWFTSTAYTRLMPNGRIVIILCMTGDTPVMLADGTERRLDRVRVGDSVATYENGWLATSRVKNVRSNGRDSVWKITTISGRIVRANGRHPFLISDDGELKWVRTKNLTTGHKIVSVRDNGASGKELNASLMGVGNQRSAGGTARPITRKRNGLMALARRLAMPSLAGLQRSSTATASPWKNILGYLRDKAENALFVAAAKLRSIGKANFALTIVTTPATFAGFSATNATLPWDLCETNESRVPWLNTSDFTTDRVASVEPDGEEEVFDVQIDRTENFIANGLVSHNTRWHEDDIVGRIFNPDYVPKVESDKWFRLDLPAIIDEGQKTERALWPERYDLDTLKSTRAFIGERDWNALYQQRPTPPEGAFFKQSMIYTYALDEMPASHHRPYMTGDLALGTRRDNDETCVGRWMLTQDDTLYLHPDLFWERKNADASVEAIIDMMDRHKPMTTWWEKGQIDKAVGPFLKKRMSERSIYGDLQALPVAGDKGFRASSIRGRMAMGKVKFPRFAAWWPRAKEQLLKFTGSGDDASDDFVDMCSLIGQALGGQIRADKKSTNVVPIAKTGTLAWIKHQHRMEQQEQKRLEARKGF